MTTALRSLLLKSNQKIAKTTDPKKLKSFFEMVHPVSTNHKLVRFGNKHDGGYLIPYDIKNISACYSPGVDTTCDFEKDLIKYDIPCYLADASVSQPPQSHSLIDFEKKFLGQENSEKYMTLESWVESKTPTKTEFILQMDIEGGEYSVILDTDHCILKKFRILIIEFHNLENLFYDIGFDLIDITFKKLLKHYEIVHIHPNNFAKPVRHGNYLIPPLMEFTFLRKDRISYSKKTVSFPHSLDTLNNLDKEDIVLPKCWYT